MAIRILDERLAFPPAEEADPEGLVAVGGDLSVERLVLAYRRGIFPWPMPGWPLPWCSPDPRCVLFPDEVRLPRCVKPLLNRRAFEVTWNRAFREVITACRTQERPGQSGTWIRRDMLEAYCRLHEAGHAHSLELWQDGRLAGGLYGVRSGRVFSGESAFHRVPNAAKVAIVLLARSATAQGIGIIDCQMRTPLLESLGARLIPRAEFLGWLRNPPP
ncbi:MAG: leucyl/phenylalanyl-tRNA--protein transferase [Lentisphaerae bacterium]|nr:leucyl/phenylalanyl-tRNA--protein transferase [Lentisphaerota bacterium]